ncbi:MAG: tetratricopeptide repeat protein, partial [Candidatus Poseidoniaceae archaeon]|nr:tetratricopeptide repeat protein [Candidatus Poseidoniaceae archaeon]
MVGAEVAEEDPWALTGVDEVGEVSSALSSDMNMDEDLESVPTEGSDEVEMLIGEGEALTRDGNNREALTLFNKAIALDPGAEMAWFNRGVILEAQGDTRGSRQSFGITLDLNPEHGPAAANLAIILDRMGDSQGAMRWAKVALESFPGHHLLLDLMRKGDSSAPGVVADANTADISIMGQAQASEAAPERSDLVWSEDDVKDAMDAHGIRDREAVLEEARLHDADGNLYLDKEELHSA